MAQIILTFGLEKEKLRVVRRTALKNGMHVKEISRRNNKLDRPGVPTRNDGILRDRLHTDGCLSRRL